MTDLKDLKDLKEEIAGDIADSVVKFYIDPELAAQAAIDIIQPHWDSMEEELGVRSEYIDRANKNTEYWREQATELESELERLDATLTAKIDELQGENRRAKVLYRMEIAKTKEQQAKIDRAVEALEVISKSHLSFGKVAQQALKELKDEDD